MFDLASIVEKGIKPTTLLICSVTGFDASDYVENLAYDLNKRLTSIVIHSSEGFTLDEKAIDNLSKSGRWVLLKDVNLAPQWLVQSKKNPIFKFIIRLESFYQLKSNQIYPAIYYVWEDV
jgi:dynein heavy chain 1